NAVAGTADGGLLAASLQFGQNHPSSLLRYDDSGKLVWSKLSDAGLLGMGLDGIGNIYLLADSWPDGDVAEIKLDQNGTVLWQHLFIFQLSSSVYVGGIFNYAVVPDGTSYLAGNVVDFTALDVHLPLIASLDSQGDVKFAKVGAWAGVARCIAASGEDV